jgi:hypothetical protein
MKFIEIEIDDVIHNIAKNANKINWYQAFTKERSHYEI